MSDHVDLSAQYDAFVRSIQPRLRPSFKKGQQASRRAYVERMKEAWVRALLAQTASRDRPVRP